MADRPIKECFTLADGVKIHYMQLGAKWSHLVLVHGYSGNAYSNQYGNGVDALAADHRVTALDCRNHGCSDKPEPGGPGKAADVIELLDGLGIDKAHIHGYSMGCSIPDIQVVQFGTSRYCRKAPLR